MAAAERERRERGREKEGAAEAGRSCATKANHISRLNSRELISRDGEWEGERERERKISFNGIE